MTLRLPLLLAWLLAVCTPALAGGLPDLSALNAQEDDEFLPVQQAFAAQVAPAADGFNVHFSIAPGYYLYQSRLHLTGSSAADASFTTQQKAETKLDKNFGEVQVFHNTLDVQVHSRGQAGLALSYQGCSEHGLCYPPQQLQLQAVAIAQQPAVPAAGNGLGEKSLFWVLLSFLGLGVGLSLTPCVFPMIPILAGIIAGQSNNRLSASKGFALALSYVAGMACSYALIGMLVAAFGARVNLTAFTQTPVVISAAALLFVVLALPMFGLFELQLPSALRNRLNNLQSRQQGGHLLSTFLMGFFAALVVSPCVSAPLAGALIYLSSTGDIVTGGSALFALGLGMGAPLLLIGLSGGRLLPKAGSWMLVIKSAFGVGLLGVAIGLLSRILPEPATLALAGMLALGCSVYLGLLETPRNGRERFARVLALITALSGVLWLSGAAMGNGSLLAPLRSGTLAVTAVAAETELTVIRSAEQLESLIAAAEQPLVVDVSADWCTSCREMAELLQSPAMQPALAPYKLVKFDISSSSRDQLDLLARWQIFGPPALLRFRHGEHDGPDLQGLPTAHELQEWLAR